MLSSDFMLREVINISTGERIGFVSDIEFNADTGNIGSIFVPDKGRKLFGSKSKGTKISWDNIKKIGDDIILVDVFTDN